MLNRDSPCTGAYVSHVVSEQSSRNESIGNAMLCTLLDRQAYNKLGCSPNHAQSSIYIVSYFWLVCLGVSENLLRISLPNSSAMLSTTKSALRTCGTYKVPAFARMYGRGTSRDKFTLSYSLSARSDLQCRINLGDPESQPFYQSRVGDQLHSPNCMLCGYMW